MSDVRDLESPWRRWALPLLVLLAFVSPGAWLVFSLPPAPIAKALNLVTVAVWLAVVGLGLIVWRWPNRRIAIATGVLFAAVLVSFVVSGNLFQVLFYDLYGNMPLVQWLAFPVMFLLAAGVVATRSRLEHALIGVVGFGTLLAVVEAYQMLTTATPRVFGSTGYSTAALSALIPVAVVLAAGRVGWMRLALYGAAVVIALDVGLLAGSTMGGLAVLFAAFVSLAIHPAIEPGPRLGVLVRRAALSGAALMVAVLVVVQIPALSGAWINPESAAGRGPSVTSRLEMWQGAQDMFVERPLLGYGPSGYRVAAVEFLPPEALQYGSDRQGSVDPTVYSPQSPHSVLWEAATRIGAAGLAALLALAGVWLFAVIKLASEDPARASLRPALAAATATAVFALLVDPVFFAIGLFAPVAAGLAVAPRDADAPDDAKAVRPPGRIAAAALAVLLAGVAVWLGMGEWRAATLWPEGPREMMEARRSVLGVLPGHPQTERQLLEMRLLFAQADAGVAEVQAEVDGAPRYIRDFAPNMVSIAMHSLGQAERTGRSDLDWEREVLDEAAQRMPPIPSLVAEQLRLEVLDGDRASIERALEDARRWGGPYPFTEEYVERAEALLADR